MHTRVLGFDLFRTDVRLRMPFRYGIATMTEGPVIFVRLHVAIDAQERTGISSDLLPPKWFTKIPEKPIGDEIDEMLQVIRQACETAVDMEAANPFDLWHQLYEAQLAWGNARSIPPLLSNFGVSLVERALIEAVARSNGRTFSESIRDNVLGIQPGRIHPELSGLTPADLLPARPLAAVTLRHTVGLADPLTDREIPDDQRLNDGLPQSLEASIRRYGLRHFKLKVNGQLEGDLDRLSRCAEVVRQTVGETFGFSLDGNEQFKSVDQFRTFWNVAVSRPDLREFFRHLLFVEQPLHRDFALQPEVAAALGHWPDRPPVVIDESDGALASLPTALSLGYAGTSHKNCKGVFKGLANRCLIEHRRRAGAGRDLMMSGEDLCNIGPVALLQDLAAMAALGIESVERNGHHYHAGLSQFPAEVRETMLASHGDLYERSEGGWPTLRVKQGRLELTSVNAAPFGTGFKLDCRMFHEIGSGGRRVPDHPS